MRICSTILGRWVLSASQARLMALRADAERHQLAHTDRPAVRALECAQGGDVPHLTVRVHGDSRGYISALFLDHQHLRHAPSPSRIRDDTTSLHRTFVHIKTPTWGLESEHVGSGWGGRQVGLWLLAFHARECIRFLGWDSNFCGVHERTSLWCDIQNKRSFVRNRS